MNHYLLKHPFDFLFSSVVCIVFSPLLLGSVLAVWLQDFKNPFYLAKRVAYGGGDFTMIKIRSMVVHAEKSGVNSTGASDKRITLVGHFIRRYKVDEISQFINVLAGDMSVVGPRPHVYELDALHSDEVPGYKLRTLVRPGVTGLAQVSGCRGETRSVREMGHRIRFDVFYVRNMNFMLDIKIIALTVLRVLQGDNKAY